MADYIVPQVLINQLISEVALNTVKNQNVLVIGPNYQLFRFDVADEKAKTYIGEYVNKTGQEGGGLVYVDRDGEKEVETGENIALQKDNLRNYGVIAYPNQAEATIPDASYTKLFADEVTVKLASLGDFYILDDETTIGIDARFRFPYAIAATNKSDLGRPTKFLKVCDGKDACDRCTGYHWECRWDDGEDAPEKKPLERSLNPGDVIRIPYNPVDANGEPVVDANGENPVKIYRSTIVEVFESVEGSEIFDSVQMADMLPDDFPLSDEQTQPADASVSGSVEYTYVYFDAEDDDSIGPIDDSSSDSTDCDDSVEYSSDAGKDKANSVQLCAQFSDVEIPRKTSVRHVWNWAPYAYTADGFEDAYGVVVTGNLRVAYSNWGGYDEAGNLPEFRVVTASLYVQHRDLIVSGAGEINSISSHTLVEATLGTHSPDNPLEFGVYMATLNSGDRLVYYAAVPTDDLAGYNSVLDKATLTSDVYIITPTTMDEEVIQSVKAHVWEISTARNKLWRIGFVATDPPETDTIYDRTNQPDGEDFFARLVLVKGRDPVEDGANIVQFMKSQDPEDPLQNTTVKFLTEVQVGDIVRIWTTNGDDDWDDTPHFTERYVSKILTNNTLQLTKGIKECGVVCKPDMIPEGSFFNVTGKATSTVYSDVNFKVEIYRKLTPAQQVAYIAAQSSALATRRIYNVFPSVASNAGVAFDGSFIACAVAGLVSSVLPQQPVTNVEINGIDDMPIVYQTYTKAQLDTIAAGGTFIVMQDRPGSKVYVRHQISTEYTSNNLMKAELSVTKNLDSISYYFAERFAPYIGKFNTSPALIKVLGNVLEGGLTALETDTAAGLYGPQVIEDGTEVLYLRQSQVNKDHGECRVRLNLPVPFNYFDLDLEI